MCRDLDSPFRHFDVANSSLTTALAHRDSAKARIATVRRTLTTSARDAEKAQKAFEKRSKREVEKYRKWFAAYFAPVADSIEKLVEYILRGLDAPTTVHDGPPAI